MPRGSTGARRVNERGSGCTVLYCGRANAVICSRSQAQYSDSGSGTCKKARHLSSKKKQVLYASRASRCVVCGRVPCPESRYIATTTHSATTATASRGAERGSRVSQAALNPRRDRVRAAEHAPRCPSRVLEHIHGLAEIVERGGRVLVDRPRVKRPHLERVFMNAPHHRHRFAHQ